MEFLTDEEAASYGRGTTGRRRGGAGEGLLPRRRRQGADRSTPGGHNQPGFSLQLTTMRSWGLFLADPLDVPNAVLAYLADQLDIADASCVKRDTERRTTRFEHAEEIKAVLGLRDLAEELICWVDARA